MSAAVVRTRLAVAAGISLFASVLGVCLSAQQATFRSGVDVVLIDVTALSRDGVPLDNLRAEDFSVTVDHKPRQIVSAQFVRYEVRGTPIKGRTTVSAPPAATPAKPVPAPPRNILLVVDEDNLEPGEGMVARNAAEKFLDRLPPDFGALQN